MGETNSPSVAHVGYDISPLSRVKFRMLTTRLTACLEWRNIVTHGQLKENLYLNSKKLTMSKQKKKKQSFYFAIRK
jgi:folate-dependent tRNA-U54 methylase TrmFO/GidA